MVIALLVLRLHLQKGPDLRTFVLTQFLFSSSYKSHRQVAKILAEPFPELRAKVLIEAFQIHEGRFHHHCPTRHLQHHHLREEYSG